MPYYIFRPVSSFHRTMQHALDIAREEIDLEIHARSRAQVRESCNSARVRDDVDLEFRAFDGVHGEAHAVDCDRALASDVAREPRGGVDREAPAAAQLIEDAHRAHAIDVALH